MTNWMRKTLSSILILFAVSAMVVPAGRASFWAFGLYEVSIEHVAPATWPVKTNRYSRGTGVGPGVGASVLYIFAAEVLSALLA